MIRTLTLLACGLCCAFYAAGQSNAKTIQAFENSYQAESNKQYDRAIQDLKSVYEEPSYEINLRLGWLLYSKKDYVQATKYYRSAIKAQPSSIEAMLGMVNAEAALENWTTVFETYQKILTLDPNHSVANYRIALAYYYRKDFTNAQKHLTKVLTLYPFDYSSMLLMAQTKVAAGKLSEAKNWYEKVLLYNPTDSAVKAIIQKL